MVETPGGTVYACTIDFGSFSQFNKIILNFNIIVQSISNVSRTCIFCGLISTLVTLFSQLLIENMEQQWTQDGSAFKEVHSIAAPIWHQTINNLLVFNIFNWLFTHIVLFSFYLIHMHRIPLIMPSRTISNALGKSNMYTALLWSWHPQFSSTTVIVQKVNTGWYLSLWSMMSFKVSSFF